MITATVLIAVMALIALMVVAVMTFFSLVFVVAIVVMIFATTIVTIIPIYVALAIARHVDLVVPTILHKIDGTTASLIAPAITSPVSSVGRWHMQV
jgi:hypothetical protein